MFEIRSIIVCFLKITIQNLIAKKHAFSILASAAADSYDQVEVLCCDVRVPWLRSLGLDHNGTAGPLCAPCQSKAQPTTYQSVQTSPRTWENIYSIELGAVAVPIIGEGIVNEAEWLNGSITEFCEKFPRLVDMRFLQTWAESTNREQMQNAASDPSSAGLGLMIPLSARTNIIRRALR
jgi:hypothetical protein